MERRNLVSIIIALLATATAVQAQTQVPIEEQLFENYNRVVPLRTCADIPCIDQSNWDSAGACFENEHYAVGVGIYPDAVNITSDTSLSLALVNGATEADIWQQEDLERDDLYLFNPTVLQHELYVGAPANLDLRDANPGCALMLLAYGQPFPFDQSSIGYSSTQNPDLNYTEFSDEARDIVNNTSWCPGDQPYSSITNYTREFRYGLNESLPRCQALAAYVSERIREQATSFWYWSSQLEDVNRPITPIEVIGGAFSGPDASREPRGPVESLGRSRTDIDGSDIGSELGSQDCPPVLPESYSLYNVSVANVPMYIGHRGMALDNIREFAPLGGRNGSTLIYTAVYRDGDDADPDVQFLCMETKDPSGGQLPFQEFFYESLGRTLGGSASLFAVAATGFTVVALQFW